MMDLFQLNAFRGDSRGTSLGEGLFVDEFRVDIDNSLLVSEEELIGEPKPKDVVELKEKDWLLFSLS